MYGENRIGSGKSGGGTMEVEIFPNGGLILGWGGRAGF
jgi:hypothetical protein